MVVLPVRSYSCFGRQTTPESLLLHEAYANLRVKAYCSFPISSIRQDGKTCDDRNRRYYRNCSKSIVMALGLVWVMLIGVAIIEN